MSRPTPRLTLITRSGCHLCEVAREAIARVAAQTGEEWVELDVDSDIELERDFGERLPVVLLDEREHGYWRVEEDRLLADLRRPGTVRP
ncbi:MULTISPECIES: glutaredoxin family protein [unclassified Solwaraspora]|uniref:glutaredoxin family protein n=1 Tax=unclassified Solwaraspora TaxID=2627926 RepID=UPI00259B4976|nr:glutaredoxin family protein [Solwaraspora sp. WMMA2056]WJK40910.1 glutaredoxin family protein [Solwaraspora sp. WMMA2056]